ncbi:helix-turn-helix transcriptional regulator [Streptomyces sp. AC563]|uniref:helix-turn-helix domain-containing protein n=1 Tax=Streptomyces buecherae TaxID=2763006 RepID=UPI00164D02E2|nr:helix-turn-helix transcriptional regulator [Streptomyces buecherae]
MQTVSTPALRLSLLRAARVRRGLTLRSAAIRSGIDPGHLSKVERGEKQLSVGALYRLAVVLELTDLVNGLEPFISRRRSG